MRTKLIILYLFFFIHLKLTNLYYSENIRNCFIFIYYNNYNCLLVLFIFIYILFDICDKLFSIALHLNYFVLLLLSYIL